MPDGKEAAFVVYNEKKKIINKDGGRKEIKVPTVKYMPMVRGIYKLANGSGDVARLSAQLVYDNDEFEYELGMEPNVVTSPPGRVSAGTSVMSMRR